MYHVRTFISLTSLVGMPPPPIPISVSSHVTLYCVNLQTSFMPSKDMVICPAAQILLPYIRANESPAHLLLPQTYS